MNFATAVILAIPASVYVLAALLLLHFWLVGAGARMSEMDGPERLLATAVATLPENSREWGAAMIGELADVRGPFGSVGVRAQLCAGGAWPRPGSWPVIALVAGMLVAATVAVGPAASAPCPAWMSSPADFVGSAGGLALLALARSAPAQGLGAGGPCHRGVAAAIALTVIFLVREPSAAAFLSPRRGRAHRRRDGLRPLGRLDFPAVAGDQPARAAARCRCRARAVGGQLVLGRVAGDTEALQSVGAFLLVFGPAFVFFVPAFWAAMADRSLRAGLKAGVWAAAAYLPLMFATWLYEALRVYAATGRMIIDVDPGPIGGSLDQTVFYCLTYVPVVGIPCAVFGAVMAAYLVRHAVEPNPAPNR